MSIYWNQIPGETLADFVNTWRLQRETQAEVEDDGFHLRRMSWQLDAMLEEKIETLATCLETPPRDPWEPGKIDPELSGLFGVFLAARQALKSAPHLPASQEVLDNAVDSLAEELWEMGCHYW